MPPLHSFCRCTTVAEFDEDNIEDLQRRARDENGKSILVPQDMNYEEWKEKYTNNVLKDNKSSSMIDKDTSNKERNMQYIDITNEMYNKAIPYKGVVKKQKFIEIQGKTYIVDGRNVVYNHDEREIEVAKLLNKTFGGNVKILPNINFPQGIKTPDYLYNGEKTDLKRITSKRANDCIKTALKNKEKQANNFIIDNTAQTINDKDLIKQIKEIYKTNGFLWVDKIYVLKDKNFIKIFKRK